MKIKLWERNPKKAHMFPMSTFSMTASLMDDSNTLQMRSTIAMDTGILGPGVDMLKQTVSISVRKQKQSSVTLKKLIWCHSSGKFVLYSIEKIQL